MASFFSPSSDPVAGSVAGGTASLAASSPSIASTTAAIVPNTPKERPPIDVGLLLGLAIAGVAIIAGVASTGFTLGYFSHPPARSSFSAERSA